MTISKRLRFEVLRRDGFKCTYCGVTAIESELHIDHVVPTALGGGDIPENLTTSCADCNLGKSSTSPSGEMVAAVNLAIAVRAAADERLHDYVYDRIEAANDFENNVLMVWDSYVPQYRAGYTPPPDLSAIHGWFAARVPLDLIELAVRLAVSAGHVPWKAKAVYAIGIVRNKMQDYSREAGDGANPFDQT